MAPTVIVKDQIAGARILTLRTMIKLEVKGMRRSRGPSASAVVRREFGFTGTTQQVLDQLNAWIKTNLHADL